MTLKVTDLHRCPTCGTDTRPQRGHPSLCLPCTEAELGFTLEEHRARINKVLSKGKKRKWIN